MHALRTTPRLLSLPMTVRLWQAEHSMAPSARRSRALSAGVAGSWILGAWPLRMSLSMCSITCSGVSDVCSDIPTSFSSADEPSSTSAHCVSSVSIKSSSMGDSVLVNLGLLSLHTLVYGNIFFFCHAPLTAGTSGLRNLLLEAGGCGLCQ